MMHDCTPRRGFALMTVLWVMTVAALVAAAAAARGRAAVSATRNRAELERAHWAALACASELRAAIDDALRAAASPIERADIWRTLDRATPDTRADGCSASLEAAGTRLDVNSASPEMLESLFATLGYGDSARAMSSALADWRDSDDVALAEGAETEWYAARHRHLPRNGPIADLRELRRVRGFENANGLDSVLSVDPGRISLATASVPVLAGVPGIAREVAELLVTRRDAGLPVRDILAVLPDVSSPSALAIETHYAELARLTTADPDAWILRARGWAGEPRNLATIEWRLVRADARTIVAATRDDF